MVTKDSFSAEEWTKIAGLPVMAASLIMMSDFSVTSVMKEVKAMGESIGELVEAGAANSTLLAAMKGEFGGGSEANAEKAQKAQNQMMGSAKNKEEAMAIILQAVKDTQGILESKGVSAEEMLSYKRLVYGVAMKTAEAAKDGGFLGIGGKQVSDKEQKALDEIKLALSL